MRSKTSGAESLGEREPEGRTDGLRLSVPGLTSGAGEREPGQLLPTTRDLRHDPAPGLKRPPTPEPEPDAVTRSGAGGPNQSNEHDAAGLHPGSVTAVPDPFPPGGSGTTKRARPAGYFPGTAGRATKGAGRGGGGLGKEPAGPPAGTLFDLAPPRDHGRFSR